MLRPEFGAAISAAFRAPVFNLFAASEGLVGCNGPDDPFSTLATDACVVELVDDDCQPVPPGTASARVLVTNLYNHVQPLIRCELTDSFARQPDDASHGHLRVAVAGRAGEMLRYAGAAHDLARRA